MASLKKTKPSIIKLLHQIMFDFNKIATKHELEYFAIGGTLLGAIRHGSVIPWDDDCDVGMLYKNKRKFLALESEFKKCGYKFVKTWFGYKVCFQNRKNNVGEDYSFPNLDVFLYRRKDNLIIPSFKAVREIWEKEFYIEEQLFPLHEHKFASFTIKVPKEPKPYLDRLYGKDWNKIAYREYDHSRDEHIERIKVKLKKEDRFPAQPVNVNKKCVKIYQVIYFLNK